MSRKACEILGELMDHTARRHGLSLPADKPEVLRIVAVDAAKEVMEDSIRREDDGRWEKGWAWRG